MGAKPSFGIAAGFMELLRASWHHTYLTSLNVKIRRCNRNRTIVNGSDRYVERSQMLSNCRNSSPSGYKFKKYTCSRGSQIPLGGAGRQMDNTQPSLPIGPSLPAPIFHELCNCANSLDPKTSFTSVLHPCELSDPLRRPHKGAFFTSSIIEGTSRSNPAKVSV